ncbi:MAG: hypothetical protein QM739_07530 [Propionivibrio sp.]
MMKLKIEAMIAAILVMLAALTILIAYMAVRPEPRFKLVLTEQGCEAMTRMGQTTTKFPQGCEVDSPATIGWNWISVGDIRLAKTVVTAIQRVDPGGSRS